MGCGGGGREMARHSHQPTRDISPVTAHQPSSQGKDRGSEDSLLLGRDGDVGKREGRAPFQSTERVQTRVQGQHSHP